MTPYYVVESPSGVTVEKKEGYQFTDQLFSVVRECSSQEEAYTCALLACSRRLELAELRCEHAMMERNALRESLTRLSDEALELETVCGLS